MQKPNFNRTLTLQWTLPDFGTSFSASWYVALFNASTSELISEDTAEWRYISLKEGKEIQIQIEKLKGVRTIGNAFQ